MLVLTRHREESIMIGDLVEVTVVEIRGNKVRLGITAPKDISVDRKEVHESKQGEEKKKGDGRR
jgi:carbon storage regulator